MLSAKDVAIVYETILTSPGMNDTVKLDVRMPRKNVLLLTKIIELGIASKNDHDTGGFLQAAGGNALEELKTVSGELLQKAGLTEMHQKLNALQSK